MSEQADIGLKFGRASVHTAKWKLPYAIINIPLTLLSTGENWFDSAAKNKLLDLNTTVGLDWLSQLYAADWNTTTGVVSPSIVYKMTEHLRNRAQITGLGSDIMQWIRGLTDYELENFAGTFRSRSADRLRMYQLVAAVLGPKMPLAIALAMLKSKFLSWYLQLDQDLLANGKYQPSIYNQLDEKTFLPKIIADFYGAIPAADYDRIEELLDVFEAYNWYLPEEVFDIADKLIGFIDIPMIPLDGVETEMTRYFVSMLDDGNGKDAKFATTEDANLVSILDYFSQFYNRVPFIAKVLSYNRDNADETRFETFLQKCSLRKVTKEWLTVASNDIIPWWLYLLKTHNDATHSRTEIMVADYSNFHNSLTLFQNFTRAIPVIAADTGNYLKVRYIKDMSMEKVLAAVCMAAFMGSFLGGFSDNQYWELHSLDDIVAYFYATGLYLNSGELFQMTGGATPTLKGETNLVANEVYGIINKISVPLYANGGGWIAPFMLFSGALSSATLPSTGPVAIDTSSPYTDSISTIASFHRMDQVWGFINIPWEVIDRKWVAEKMLLWFNPKDVPPVEAEMPKNDSGIDSGSMNTTEDASALSKYISWCEASAKAAKEKGNDESAANFNTTAEQAKKRLEELKKPKPKPTEGDASPTDKDKGDEE